jgi:hypothetical protein
MGYRFTASPAPASDEGQPQDQAGV